MIEAIAKVCASWELYEHSNGFRAKTSNIHSRCGKTFAKNVNSLRSDRTVFAHSTSFVYEEVLRLVQIV